MGACYLIVFIRKIKSNATLVRIGRMQGGNMPVTMIVINILLMFAALERGQQTADAPPPQPTVQMPASLARVLTDYETAWRDRNAAALALLFAEDGFVLPGGLPPVRGRAQIERHYAQAGGPLSLRAIAFATEGAVGYIIGGYARQKGEPDIGKFTLTLRRSSNGRWLIVSDMDNSNSRR
jgi:ketosteroid isomerase-like protein